MDGTTARSTQLLRQINSEALLRFALQEQVFTAGEAMAATGLTLRAAIRQCQLEEVRRLLLRTELTPEFIAGQCGFRGLREANRAFLDAGCEVPHALRPSLDPAAVDTRRLTRPKQ